MIDLERLTEALGDWLEKPPTEGGYSEEHSSGVPSVRLAHIDEDGYADERDPLLLDDAGIARLCVVIDAARAYGDLLANGEREWHCEYPEFDDPDCQSGMSNPQPDKTRQPRKHTQCRWVILVEVEPGEET